MTRRSAWLQAPLWIGLGAVAFVLPQFGGDYALGVAFNLAMWIALTQSWSILSALSGYVSLGHALFVGVGAYATVLLIDAWPLPLALAAAAVAAFVLALAIGAPVLRVRGPYFVILTFGISELAKFIVMRVETALGQFSRLIFNAPPVKTLYLIMAALACAATLAAVIVRGSKFGHGLIAIREDETAAEAVGVPVARLKTLAFALSAVIPGAVGGLVALRTSYFEPAQAFDPAVSFSIVTMAVVGGSDDFRGPLVGAVFFVGLSETLWARFPQFYMILLGAALILFTLFAPKGIMGLASRRGA
jgi:branched-chain amino acid transport system permease protein